MTPPDPKLTATIAGQILRAPAEILRVLNSLVMRGERLIVDLGGGKHLFRTRLRYVDPGHAYIIVELSDDEESNKALLARARATFHAEPGGWRVEFAAADPKPTSPNEGAPGIRFRFPEIVAGHRRRADDRTEAKQQFRCVVDEEGVMPFEAIMTNISKGGVGFLQYDPDISLEPGTVLKGCRIEGPDGLSIVVDMEVRYSQLVDLGDGKQAQSSGCRFLKLTPELAKQIVELFRFKS